MIHETAIIHDNVALGHNVLIEAQCIIGQPFNGYDDEPTVIGDNAVIRSGTCIYAGNRIGSNFQTGHKANIRELNTIGDRVSVGTLSVVEHHVHIGDDVRLHTQVFVPEYSVLEAHAWLGPNVVLTNALYPQHPNVKHSLRGPTVRTHARIGANATLLPGVDVGAYALVGAGSVVTRDVDARTIVAGNPARFLRAVDY
jgi:acetyltransferase-like isoleucine patch superfamily enzyme